MKYIPGYLHEFYQKPRFIQLEHGFTISILKEGYRFEDLMDFNRYDILLDSYELFKGNIIEFRLFKQPIEYKDNRPHLFIDKIINDKIEAIIERESILSWEFLNHNLTNKLRNDGTFGSLFSDITKIITRDTKINQIIDGN